MARKYKFQVQLGAFVIIMLASAGLYYSAKIGADAATEALLGLTAAAMAAAIWVS